MKKEIAHFGITAEEELDLKHQGSLGGQQLVNRAGRIQDEISNFIEPSEGEFTTGGQPAEKPEVAMTSSSQEKTQQRSPEAATANPKLAKHEKKHHYKK